MASFSYSLNGTVLTIKLTGGTWGSYYRFFVRYADDASSVVYKDDFYCPQSGKITVDIDLAPGETYAFNAGKTENGSTSWYWSPGPIITVSSGGGGGGDDPYPPAPSRPDDWYWWSTIASGERVNISADEWNAFCDRINEFRSYCGFSDYPFTYVWSGMLISADIVNEAYYAIADMKYGALPATSGGTMYASFFLKLQDTLNSIA